MTVWKMYIFILYYYSRVTIFWSPKTRTLGPANTWANSNDTQRYLINFNTFKVGYASSVWIENCYIVILLYENTTCPGKTGQLVTLYYSNYVKCQILVSLIITMQ